MTDGGERGRQVALSVTVVAIVGALLLLIWNPAGGEPSQEPDQKGSAPQKKVKMDDAGFASGKDSVTHDENAPMYLTVPRLGHLRQSKVPTSGGDDEGALKNSAGVHLKGTGFPWQQGANVYISGHRMGFPGTPSNKTFYDLNRIQKGDDVILTDDAGNSYLYRVYEIVRVGPKDVNVTMPVPGKSIVSLQTCTLPDYTKRLIVRAEKVT